MKRRGPLARHGPQVEIRVFRRDLPSACARRSFQRDKRHKPRLRREQAPTPLRASGWKPNREEHPCIGLAVWEISPVTTICTADKNRLTVRGVRNGARYLVKKKSNGWWIEPAPQPRGRVR